VIPQPALSALASVIGAPSLAPEDVVVTRLGGLSNANFKVETKAGTFVVRLLRRDLVGISTAV
jgi:Ser/Thr protein kinase RdoA (MazF antagonist)